MYLVTGKEMKSIERHAMESYSIPGIILMEHAAAAVADRIVEMLERDSKIAVVCGRGNNGGDGFAVSRLLLFKGYCVTTIVVGDSFSIKGDALVNFEVLKRINSDIVFVETIDEVLAAYNKILHADSVVDAIFGTGLESNVRDLESAVIDAINQSNAKTISVDIPSGVNGNTGQVMGIAVNADVTVSFDSPKMGNIMYPGANHNGQLDIVKIGIPDESYESIEIERRVISREIAREFLPSRDKDGHKGTFGRASMIAGSFGMEGAAVLSSSSSLRSGLGLLKLFIPRSINNIIKVSVPEAVTKLLEEERDGIFDMESVESIMDGIRYSSVVAIGPGCGIYDGVEEALRRILIESDKKVVIDADGLNILSRNIGWLEDSSNEIAITPHIAEMARLADMTVEEVSRNQINVAVEHAAKWGVTVVLKSARTVIASPDGKVFVNCTGNSGMATAGSGDVLTGIITSFIAQGIGVFEACVLGTYVHGCAGDYAAEKLGEYGMVASDIVTEIPYVLRDLGCTAEKQ